MTKEQFDYIVKTFGNPDLPEAERWKSIQSLHIFGSYDTIGSFQGMLKNDQIYYMNHETMGPGFFIMNYPDNSYETINNDYGIIFIPIEKIDIVSMIGMEKYGNDYIYGVSDLINHMKPGTITEIPVKILVPRVMIPAANAATNKISFKYNHYEDLTDADFSFSFKDKTYADLTEIKDNEGNAVDRPVRPGKYYVTIKCTKDGYKGETTAPYIIT